MTNRCVNCHSTQLSNIDGLFYCNDCGSQLRTLRELETETDDFGGFRTMLKQQKPKKEKKNKENKVLPEQNFRHRVVVDKDYPYYLRAVGERLTTATYLLVKITTILHKKFGFPSGITDVSLSLLQNYLSASGAAFFSNEVALDEEDAYIAEFKKTQAELEVDRKAEIEKIQEQRRQSVKLERSQLPVWQQSFLAENDTANQEEEFNEEHLLNIEVMKFVNTGLSKNAYRTANTMILNMDILLCIAYLAAHHLNCNWVLLSDLQRWHREDRFKISGRNIFTLSTCFYSKNKLVNSNKYFRETRTTILQLSTSEAYRALSFFVQVVRIPRSLTFFTIEKMLHRLMFDLNLPACLWSRLKFVLKFLPIVTNYYDHGKLRSACEFFTSDDLLRRYTNPKFKNFYKKSLHRSANGPYLYTSMTAEGKNLLAILPVETKAAAIIMFALKLMFALDDKTEHEIDKIAQKKEDSFKFVDWLHQVELRNIVQSGISVENVLNLTFTVENKLVIEKALYSYALPGRMHRVIRDSWINPKRTLNSNAEKPFYDCFLSDHVVSEEDDDSLACYSPLRFCGQQTPEIDTDAPEPNQLRFELYFRQFNKNKMDYSALLESFGPIDLHEELSSSDVKCRKLFPAMCKCKQIPREMHKFYWNKKKPLLEMEFILYRFRDESRTFSETFMRLMAAMAMSTSERIEVLYLVFTMIETTFLNNDLLKNLAPELVPTPTARREVKRRGSLISLTDENDDDVKKVANEHETEADSDDTDELLSDFSDLEFDELVVHKHKLKKKNISSNEVAFVRYMMENFW